MKTWIPAFIVVVVVLSELALGDPITSDTGCPSRGPGVAVDAPDFLSATGTEWKHLSLDMAIDARR